MQKLKNNKARPTFSGSYLKKACNRVVTQIKIKTMIYDKKCFSWGHKRFLLVLRSADGYFEKCYVFIFSIYF